jgi:hypothetical protein
MEDKIEVIFFNYSTSRHKIVDVGDIEKVANNSYEILKIMSVNINIPYVIIKTKCIKLHLEG